MGWGDCGKDDLGRPIGYLHAATCDHPGCQHRIDHGLDFACGGEHGYSGCCARYFCGKHLGHYAASDEDDGRVLCEGCGAALQGKTAEATTYWQEVDQALLYGLATRKNQDHRALRARLR